MVTKDAKHWSQCQQENCRASHFDSRIIPNCTHYKARHLIDSNDWHQNELDYPHFPSFDS